MTITEALEIQRGARPLSTIFEVQLACSFTPLHLKTLLAGHLQQRVPAKRAVVLEGIFGDLVGTIERSTAAAIAVVLEWRDLDPRLQYREGGAWGNALEGDLLGTAKTMLGRMQAVIEQLPPHTLVALSVPTLPLPPVFTPPTWQAGNVEVSLRRELLAFASRLTSRRNLTLLNTDWLAEHSPQTTRLDLKSELLIGFPYTLSHADQLAAALARSLAPVQPLKGVITDLDNTLWSGLVGEVGPDGVRWDAASRYYLHGLYQKTLAALADSGILVGIASKNDPDVVAAALKRQDLLLPPDSVFPIEVHWSPKSESVTRILKKWNISAGAVAFVDDTPLELAEVASAHPEITCLPFPVGDYAGVWKLLGQLRDLCGKSHLNEEDALRLASVRGGAQFEEQSSTASSGDEFLSTVNAAITFDFDASADQPRTLELVNKTNQFNLNGARFTEAEWRARLAGPGAFLAAVKYQDKFGALGVIAVVQGHHANQTLHIDTWVISCRAFSRRIEHQTLKTLLERFDASAVDCDFSPTAKNGPVAEFFATILGRTPAGAFKFNKHQFETSCPALYARVEETTGVTLNG